MQGNPKSMIRINHYRGKINISPDIEKFMGTSLQIYATTMRLPLFAKTALSNN